MTINDTVRAAVKIALKENDFTAEPLEALRYVRSLPREMRAEARAAVDYVYQHGYAPRSISGRKARTVAA